MSTQDLKRAGQTLRRRRKELGWTTLDIQRSLGMDTGELSRLENGRITSPGLEKVMRYAAYLGFTPNEIAAEYGLWVLPDEGHLAQLFRRLEVLGEGKRVRILDVLESMIDGAIHEECRQY